MTDNADLIDLIVKKVEQIREQGLASPYVHQLPKEGNWGYVQTLWPVAVAVGVLSDALEAADQRAAQAEAELKDAYRTDIPSLKEQRDELAAVVEKVRAWTDRNKGTGYGTGTGASALEILDILATAPADALREHDALVWDEGAGDMAEHIDNGAGWEIQNPYREEQS